MLSCCSGRLKSLVNVFVVACVGVIAAWLLTAWASSAAPSAQAAGVQLGPDHTRQGEPGENILYNHTLTNTGGVTDAFVVEVLSTQGWPVALSAGTYPSRTDSLPLQVGPHMTASFQVSLTVPLKANGVTEVTIITATSQLSPTVQDTAIDTTVVSARLYFPFVAQRWPPVPYRSTLDPIANTDGDGFYTVTWTSAELADAYSLEEDDNADFAHPTEVYDGPGTTWTVPDPGKTAGTYYYRVRGRNTWGDGAYSNVRAVTVLSPGTPTLNAIDNADGNSDYRVTWSGVARATGYALEEDTHQGFDSPTIVFTGAGTSWLAIDKMPGTYYYRVRATGPTGESGWSNVEAATVQPLRTDDVSLSAGECTTLRWDFDNIKAIYISFGYGYDKEGVPGHGTRRVCPSVSTTYEALVINRDGSSKTYKSTVGVTGSGCGDPVIERFSPTTYHVHPGEKFSIFWDVECAQTVKLIIGDGPEEPVVGHGSRVDVTIYATTLFRLKVEKSDGSFVYASFTVYIV